MSRDNRIALRVYGDDCSVFIDIQVLSKSEDNVGRFYRFLTPQDNNLDLQVKVAPDSFRTQCRCVQFVNIIRRAGHASKSSLLKLL
jgi:hypothetical protein